LVDNFLSDAFQRIVCAGPVGDEEDGVFPLGDFAGRVSCDELSEGDNAIGVEFAREPDKAAGLVRAMWSICHACP
jgi:hypothetical protein